MKALKIVRFVETLFVRRVGMAPPERDEIGEALAETSGNVTEAAKKLGLSATRVALYGSRFNLASEVLFNGLPSPKFSVVNNTVIYATLPTLLEGRRIETVDVLADDFRDATNSMMLFEVRDRSMTGIAKLMQHYMKLLLTTPGRDIFKKSEGGGLLDALGMVVDPENPAPLTSLIVAAVNRTRDQMISSQSVRHVPADERLRRVDIARLDFDKQTLALILWLRFVTASGQQAMTNVGLA